MRAVVLIDNNDALGLKGEWGLSIYIEANDKKILLDTGKTGLFLENAKALNIDISKVDFGVLSHGHYDHAGGIKSFFSVNDSAIFYLRKGTFENCFKLFEGREKYIGIPKGTLSAFNDRITYVEGDFEISKGIFLVPHKTQNLKRIGKREKMLQKKHGFYYTDDFSHEQSLVVDTEKGLVIFNSCSHGGASNIIEEIRNTFPDKSVYGIVGGFHLFNKTKEEINKFAETLKETGVELIVTGHCTEKCGLEELREVLGDKVKELSIGLVMEI